MKSDEYAHVHFELRLSEDHKKVTIVILSPDEVIDNELLLGSLVAVLEGIEGGELSPFKEQKKIRSGTH